MHLGGRAEERGGEGGGGRRSSALQGSPFQDQRAGETECLHFPDIVAPFSSNYVDASLMPRTLLQKNLPTFFKSILHFDSIGLRIFKSMLYLNEQQHKYAKKSSYVIFLVHCAQSEINV